MIQKFVQDKVIVLMKIVANVKKGILVITVGYRYVMVTELIIQEFVQEKVIVLHTIFVYVMTLLIPEMIVQSKECATKWGLMKEEYVQDVVNVLTLMIANVMMVMLVIVVRLN